jgi:hypothetical protein
VVSGFLSLIVCPLGNRLRRSADCSVHNAIENGRSANACTDTFPKIREPLFSSSTGSDHRSPNTQDEGSAGLDDTVTRLGVRKGSECDLSIRCRALRSDRLHL